MQDIARRRIGTVLILLGLVLVLIPLGRLAHARVYYELVARGIITLDSDPVLDAGAEPPPVSTTDPEPPSSPGPDLNPDPEPGPAPEPVWRIYITKIRLARTLVYGVSPEDLKKGPGVYPHGVKPGEHGNLSIAGHRNAYGSPFWFLDRLRAGDEIYITVGETAYLYVVERSWVVKPNDWSVIAQTDYDAVTLTTCHPLGSTEQRLIVRGRLARVQDSVPSGVSR